MISEPSRHCTVELQALPSRIGQVRRIISAQLRYWHLDPLIDQAALGVTELLTNVHRHAQPDKTCTVEIEFLLERLTVSVHDHDPRLPTVREADASSTSGRGLALIAAVSESWGSGRGAGPGRSSGSPFRPPPCSPRCGRTRCTGRRPTVRSVMSTPRPWRRWPTPTPGPPRWAEGCPVAGRTRSGAPGGAPPAVKVAVELTVVVMRRLPDRYGRTARPARRAVASTRPRRSRPPRTGGRAG